MLLRFAGSLSLRPVLIVPYVVLVITLALTVGVLSYTAGARAVTQVSAQLLRETVGRITQAIDRHIVGSGAVLESAFPDGMPAPSTIEAQFDELRTRFWIATSLHIDPNNYVYYGNESGQSLGLYRHSPQHAELRMKLKADEHRAVYRYEGIDGPLQFVRRETALFDPRVRPWYADGRLREGHTWTSVYIDFVTRELVATRARRVLSSSGEFEGVVATDVSLQRLNDFVGRLEVSPKGIAFIIEPDGKLIASSASANVQPGPDGSNARVLAEDSEHWLVRAAYQAAREHLERTGADGRGPSVIGFETKGETIHVAFDRIRDDAGLDWITVVAVPASDFLSDLGGNALRTVMLAALAVLLAVLIGLRILGWVTGDLRRLAETAAKVGDGELDSPVGITRRDEIGSLARSFESMQQRLQTDKLTGLANREALLLQLRKRIRRHAQTPDAEGFAVLFIDLNGFKQINDRFGHDAGDAVLFEIGGRLAMSVRASDVVARYAGDEFVIVLDGVVDHAQMANARRDIEAALQTPLWSLGPDGASIGLGAAVGEAFFPTDGKDPETLLKHADRRMYEDKFTSRQTVAGSENPR